jgi:ABC-type Mn2+/Zn2+ transport system permease subunit
MRRRMAAAYALGAAAYLLGLWLSLVSDMPPGPLVVCVMALLGVLVFVMPQPRPR